MVLFIIRRVCGVSNSLCCCKGFLPIDVWTRMVWLCLLDSHDLGFVALQSTTASSEENWLHPIYCFFCSLLFVGALFIFRAPNMERIMFWSFIIGNVLYYAIGIGLAFAFKDNRAFCKYICPITVFLKPASYYSLLRVKNDMGKCVFCGKCKKVCPMDVDVPYNSRKRLNATECILCFNCIDECLNKALYL